VKIFKGGASYKSSGTSDIDRCLLFLSCLYLNLFLSPSFVLFVHLVSPSIHLCTVVCILLELTDMWDTLFPMLCNPVFFFGRYFNINGGCEDRQLQAHGALPHVTTTVFIVIVPRP
jgi:hypothetical protein